MIVITGTSKGIGKALAETYLAAGEKVIGISRSNAIEDENFEFFNVDLLQSITISELSPLIKVWCKSAQNLTFIHNAGVLGEINRFSQKTDDTKSVFQVNLFAGIELLHLFLKFRSKEQHFDCVFMSSGAGKRPIPSWAAYCSSKSAVDLFLQTVYLEETELGRTHFRCFSVSPGVVDTDMQAQIRKTKADNFSTRNTFKGYYDKLELENPRSIAKKLKLFLEKSEENQVLVSLKDFR